MITQDSTRAEALSEAAEVWAKVRRITRSGEILGGYPRDIIMGIPPKDIDLFIPTRMFPNSIAQDRIVARLGAAFRQELISNMPSPEYAEGFRVYTCVSNLGTYQPLNVIFRNTPGDVLETFDFDVCKAYFTNGTPQLTYQAHRAFANSEMRLLLTPTSSSDTQRLADHAKRIKAKYPLLVVMVDPVALGAAAFRDLYETFVHEGVMNAPRAILSTEGQDTVGDQVRLQNGASPRREIDWTDWGILGASPISNSIQDREDIRTGFQVGAQRRSAELLGWLNAATRGSQGVLSRPQ